MLIFGGSAESWFGCISDMQSIVDSKSLFRHIKGIHVEICNAIVTPRLKLHRITKLDYSCDNRAAK